MSVLSLIGYQKNYQDVVRVLAKMQRSIDNYEKKEGHNKEWASDRREMIDVLARFIEHSNYTVIELEQQRKDAYEDGLKKGKQIASRQYNDNPRADRYFDKEAYRARTITAARQKWDI